MPDLENELQELALAEQHVMRGEHNLARLKRALETADPDSPSWDVGHSALAAAEEAQVLFIEHRDSILATVEKLRQGKL
jgi:hypothetical protein